MIHYSTINLLLATRVQYHCLEDRLPPSIGLIILKATQRFCRVLTYTWYVHTWVRSTCHAHIALCDGHVSAKVSLKQASNPRVNGSHSMIPGHADQWTACIYNTILGISELLTMSRTINSRSKRDNSESCRPIFSIGVLYWSYYKNV